MTTAPEIKERLDNHQKILDKQDSEIMKLQETQTKMLINFAEMSTKLSSIEMNQFELRKTMSESLTEQRDLIKVLIEKNAENDRQNNNMLQQNQNKLWELIWKGMALVGALSGLGNILKDSIK